MVRNAVRLILKETLGGEAGHALGRGYYYGENREVSHQNFRH